MPGRITANAIRSVVQAPSDTRTGPVARAATRPGQRKIHIYQGIGYQDIESRKYFCKDRKN